MRLCVWKLYSGFDVVHGQLTFFVSIQRVEVGLAHRRASSRLSCVYRFVVFFQLNHDDVGVENRLELNMLVVFSVSKHFHVQLYSIGLSSLRDGTLFHLIVRHCIYAGLGYM